MGDYDRILKENIESLILPLGQKLLGLNIRHMQDMPANLTLTLERQPDFLKLVTDGEGNKFILHLEFQTANDLHMASRMLTYFALLYEKYGKEVKQYVIYLGAKKLSMDHKLEVGLTKHEFALVNLLEVDAEKLLDEAVQPEEAVLAVLAHFQKKEAKVILNKILNKLKELSTEERLLKRYVKQLEILANLRNLQEETIRQTEAMALTYDIKKDIRYQQGRADGEKRGEERGAVRLKEEKRAVAASLKAEGDPIDKITRITGLSIEEILQL